VSGSGGAMADVLFVVVTVVFFAVALLYVSACASLE
jgi:hypothetical protein